MSTRIETATTAPWSDVEHAMTGGGDGASCWCQWFLLSGREFNANSREDLRDRMRNELVSSEVSPALVVYVDDVAAGWVRVNPRVGMDRLLRSAVLKGSVEAKDDESVWAISCLIVRREFRGRGLTHELVEAAVAHAGANGARVIEAYPYDTDVHPTSNNDLFHGSVKMFAAHGFDVVARPTKSRAVMSRAL